MSAPGRSNGGALLSPTRRAILQHLQMHGQSSKDHLEAALHRYASWRIRVDTVPAAHKHWLTSHLNELRAAGHIGKRINDAGEVVFFVGTEAVQTTPGGGEPEEPLQTAAPRHINVMHGPVYRPAPWVPARAGALAHVELPSLISARRVPFQGRDAIPTKAECQ